MVLEPRGQIVLPFGPLTEGGLLQARLVNADALEADNRRWALAPGDKPDKALVMSPSPEARDDLARVLLAVNQNSDRDRDRSGQIRSRDAPRYRLAVLDDVYDPGIKAAAHLIIYPPPWLEDSPPPSWQLPVVSTVAVAEMQERGDGEQLTGHSRSARHVFLACRHGWMCWRTAPARAAADLSAWQPSATTLAARVGMIAFSRERPYAARSGQARGAGADR